MSRPFIHEFPKYQSVSNVAILITIQLPQSPHTVICTSEKYKLLNNTNIIS